MRKLDLKTNRKNVLEYLNEFKRTIPKRNSIFSRKANVDVSKLESIKDKIELFFERGALISPMSIDKDSIDTYIENISLVKQFPGELSPEAMLESEIFKQTENAKSTRRILVPSVMENNSQVIENYDKMVAYYLLMGGDKPVERFSRVEMSMKQFCVSPDIGVAIMKYGDEITTKLEEIATSKTKSPKEWEFFKGQVLHSFMTAEKIGNRSVNLEEHSEWEERLIRLGILERRIDRSEGKKQTFRESIKYDVTNTEKDKDENKGRVTLEIQLLKKAEQQYINTGVIPLGYKKDENGKIVRILPKLEDKRTDRLSAGSNLSATAKKREVQETTR